MTCEGNAVAGRARLVVLRARRRSTAAIWRLQPVAIRRPRDRRCSESGDARGHRLARVSLTISTHHVFFYEPSLGVRAEITAVPDGERNGPERGSPPAAGNTNRRTAISEAKLKSVASGVAARARRTKVGLSRVPLHYQAVSPSLAATGHRRRRMATGCSHQIAAVLLLRALSIVEVLRVRVR